MQESAEDPTIYEVIRAEHAGISQLLEELRGEEADEPEELLATVRDQLERHARAEEAVFYDVLVQSGDEKLRTLAREAEAEHSEVRRLLAELEAMPADDAKWAAGVESLALAVQRHVEREESEIFTAMEAILDDDQARTLAETFEAMEARVESEEAA
ncbi:hemerythrin domain-containing protein [Nannocystis sp. SCPEA4]|uniref:hemerythrin domain-containing protein n=1 Tax=Nannocystis sp. SCPEA4 TaxID=2996787 RepID=UPI002271B29E|nr:hemerythrin domain-containing protein [Nannocystis sp. SCPEA4]MCY1059020.1 hemerythrin domain-containing protein [Nannocystis sp. SCPEA4]